MKNDSQKEESRSSRLDSPNLNCSIGETKYPKDNIRDYKQASGKFISNSCLI